MKFLSYLYISFIALLIVSSDMGALPSWFGIYKLIPCGDKIGHFILIGTFSLAFNILSNFRFFSIFTGKVFLGSLIIFIFITFEEASQIFLSNRTFSLADLTANYLGIIFIGELLGRKLSKKPLTIAATSNGEPARK